ncbi:MAG: phycobiliprotein lyase [Phormidium sp. BM_Day4_Bin.17]|nr:phycobiliprotein lyase [Phormidium sp. BM_Day4_Bin.17]UCJ13650.1 MAG: phycobiliprotein lyase [Phormidium sp. PBR-2020]
MTVSLQHQPLTAEALAEQFFRNCAGEWTSQRRYYSLTSGETQEVTSEITVEFLEPERELLQELAQRHQLESDTPFLCGSRVTWESHYDGVSRKPSRGKTVFGVRGDILYRDRGFATPKPVIADFWFTNPETMCLKTEYNNSSFEEELKLIGEKYRTRQTVICRDGEELMIGQYLETRR